MRNDIETALPRERRFSIYCFSTGSMRFRVMMYPMIMNVALTAQLTGKTIIIDSQVWYILKPVNTQMIRTPHTQMRVVSAGTSDFPRPLIAPDRLSISTLSVSA